MACGTGLANMKAPGFDEGDIFIVTDPTTRVNNEVRSEGPLIGLYEVREIRVDEEGVPVLHGRAVDINTAPRWVKFVYWKCRKIPRPSLYGEDQ